MEIWVYDINFKALDVIDSYQSCIWPVHYSQASSCEILLGFNTLLLSLLKTGDEYNYLWFKEKDKWMIIEDIQIDSSIEDGYYILVTGRSLESILYRRIVWKQTILTGNLQNGIKRLLTENVISPSDRDRTIPNFIFKESTDESIKKLTIDTQFTGDYVHDAISALCELNNIGFRISMSDKHEFIFELYKGADRSYDQIKLPYVVFSPKFDNILSSQYLESSKEHKTITLVAGEGEGSSRRTLTVVGKKNPKGLYRREGFTDAREISSQTDKGSISSIEYNKLLKEKGEKYLDELKVTRLFEGDIDFNSMFIYGKDFEIGDIVQLENELGLEATARLCEVIHSRDDTGYEVYPTFKIIEEDGDK